MELLVHLTQPAVGDVRIDLRGSDARVPKHFLNRADIRAIAEQRRAKTVPQGMG